MNNSVGDQINASARDGGSAAIAFVPTSSGFGAECINVNLAHELNSERRQKIWQGVLNYQLIFFRNQKLEKKDQVKFGERFGEFEIPVNKDYWSPDFQQLHVVSNRDSEGNLASAKAMETRGNYFWHTDASYMQRPSSITMLYALEVPDSGGDTKFANMYAAYDALDEGMKQRLAGLRAVHDWAQSRINSGSRPATQEEKKKAPSTSHPIVRTHPETGRKGLYIGNHTSHIEGMDKDEGRKLLAELVEHATQPQFVYTHKWRSGDLVMWDNRCLLHKASEDYDMSKQARVLHRTVLQGTVPV